MHRGRMVAFVGAFLVTLMLAEGTLAAQGYFIQADMVRSEAGTPRGPVCVPDGAFFPGEAVVFRVKVFDLATGQEVERPTIEERGLQVRVELGDGTVLRAAYLAHPPDPNAPAHDEYWAAFWPIPKNYPGGTLTWKVVAQDREGRVGEFTPIGQEVGLGMLTILPSTEGA
ncbi:MAG: hypothetical protein IMX02_01885 [Limnochordaceae bacterium]|nr:hypothetical protein [Limnochordaceae bacterium]